VSEQARPFERVRESFAKQGLMELLGAEVSEVGEGWCVKEAPYSEKLTQQQSYFHGAVAGTLGDSAGGYAALTLAPEIHEVLTVRPLARRGRASPPSLHSRPQKHPQFPALPLWRGRGWRSSVAAF
jgi:acyl-coenzyme A thioesterase PaaI-like protein